MTSYRHWAKNLRYRCAHCHRRTENGAWLCPSCAPAATKQYADENPTIIDSYVQAGLAEIERLHVVYADFDAYLEQHPPVG